MVGQINKSIGNKTGVPSPDATPVLFMKFINMEQQTLFKGRDRRRKGWFWLDNDYLNGYAKLFGATGTAIYVSLCRHADNETQRCFPAIKTIAEELNIGESTVKQYIKIFEKYQIIYTQRQKDSITKRWLNNIYQLNDKEEWIKPDKPLKKKRINSQSQPLAMESQSQPLLKPEPENFNSQSQPLAHNKTNINKTHVKEATASAVAEVSNKQINSLINCFKDISPTNYEKWFGVPPQRKAAANLLEKYPPEKLEILIRQILPQINVLSYVSKDSKAFSPYELEKNFDKIVAKIKELQIKRSGLNKKIEMV